MTSAYIGVGSNIQPERNIPAAVDELAASGLHILRSSRFYRTAAINRPDQPDYANGVWLCPTELALEELRCLLREVEARLGRTRSGDRYAARTIDLDVLLYGDLVLESEELTLPDPHLFERPFLAICLEEIDPALVVPGDAIPIKKLLPSGPARGLEEYATISQTIQTKLEKSK